MMGPDKIPLGLGNFFLYSAVWLVWSSFDFCPFIVPIRAEPTLDEILLNWKLHTFIYEHYTHFACITHILFTCFECNSLCRASRRIWIWEAPNSFKWKMCVCVCVCVCLYKRERASGRALIGADLEAWAKNCRLCQAGIFGLCSAWKIIMEFFFDSKKMLATPAFRHWSTRLRLNSAALLCFITVKMFRLRVCTWNRKALLICLSIWGCESRLYFLLGFS